MPKDWTGGTASTFKTIGASNHTDHDRQPHDYYATEPLAVEHLMRLESFNHHIWEPSCGEGHISEVLRSYNHEVLSTDLIDRGYAHQSQTLDFLQTTTVPDNSVVDQPFDIITNPPYKYAQEFVQHSLDLIPYGSKVAMFLKLTFLEGKARKELFATHPPIRVWVSSSRLKCAMNGDFQGTGGSATAYAWFIWQKGFQGDPIIKWFN